MQRSLRPNGSLLHAARSAASNGKTHLKRGAEASLSVSAGEGNEAPAWKAGPSLEERRSPVSLKRFVLAAVLMAGLAAQSHAQQAPEEHLIKVLRTTNVAQTNRYIPKVYTVENVNPFSLWRWVNRTARLHEGTFHMFGKPDVEGDFDSVNSGKIVLVVPDNKQEGIDEMMKLIDRPGLTSSGGVTFFYFRPQHRSVKDAGFIGIIDELSLDSTSAGVGKTKHPDVEANMFMLYDAASGVENVQRLLPLFDVAPPQVSIEATVYEINVDSESRVGLDYVAWKNGPGRHLFAFGAFGERTGGSGVFGLPGSALQGEGANYALYLDVPSAFFDFLVVKGKARVMTAAKISARNLIPASLTSGDTILYYHTRVGPAANAGIRPESLPLDPDDIPEDNNGNKTNIYPDNRTVVGTQVIRELTGSKSGVELHITPLIADNEINLKIDTSVVSHTGFDDKGAPILAERTAKSEIRVRDGQETILGGYSREVFVQRADKVPVLGSLPVIGYLFGGEANTTERRRVVIVVTPHVIKDFSAMTYEGTKINAALIRSKALRKKATEVPKTEVGFDQWILDTEQ